MRKGKEKRHTKKKRHAKVNQNKNHFCKRMRERHGIHVTSSIIASIVRQIQNPKRSTFVEKQSNTKSLHRVKVCGKEILVAYCHSTKMPKTTLFEGETANLLGYWR